MEKKFKIISSVWLDMGTWVAESVQDVLEQMALQAGFSSYEDSCEEFGPFDGTIEEIK